MAYAETCDPTQDADAHHDIEGPLFYALPADVRDALTAHFRGAMPDLAAMQGEPANGPDL